MRCPRDRVLLDDNPPPIVSKPKITDRIEPGGRPSQQQSGPDVAAVAQRVVLYEEDPTDPQGKRAVGSAIWRTEAVSPGTGKPPPMLKNAEGAKLRKLNAEHAVVDIQDASLPMALGDQIEIWAHYSDATVNLHDRIYGIRNGAVEEMFRIEG